MQFFCENNYGQGFGGEFEQSSALSARLALPSISRQTSERFIFCINCGNLLYGVQNLLNYSARGCHNCI